VEASAERQVNEARVSEVADNEEAKKLRPPRRRQPIRSLQAFRRRTVHHRTAWV